MATNYKNTVYKYYNNTKNTFPAYATKTGTITIASGQKIAVGAGTAFTTELKVGGWLYIPAQNELRKITGIHTDTSLAIDYAFTSAVAALTAVLYIEPNNYKEISVAIPIGSGNGVLDGETLPAGIGVSFSKASRGANQSGVEDLVDPVIIDVTGTQATVIGIKG